ncbi:Transposase [Pseudovibrio sp. Ad37]|nr:Transposase [Pseudovibrio sp. Ad37]KZL25842.1 Transposase [Pseudovibrio sp. Ad37]
MGQNTKTASVAAERMVKDIRRKTRKRYSTEDKICIVLAGLRGEDCIAELCRQEGLSQGLYYSWSKEFREAGKKRLAGDTARQANTGEVKQLRKEARDLKEVFAEQALELQLL